VLKTAIKFPTASAPPKANARSTRRFSPKNILLV
jgi:hypothetical protein